MDKKMVVVTGAASGMGMATARRLARPDRVLFLVDRDPDRLEAAREQLADDACGDSVHLVQADVSDEDSVRDLAARVRSAGQFEILAHAAGISPTMADWRTVMRVDLIGTAIVVDAFRPLATPGTVGVCWSSSAAYMGAPARGDADIDALLDEPRALDLLDRLESLSARPFDGPGGPSAAYAWAKRGVIRLVRREAAAWGRSGARLVAVSPGIVDTSMSRFEKGLRPGMQQMVEACPIPRFGTAGEIANLVAFLVSMEASFITGTDIVIDGGFATVMADRDVGA